MCGIAGIYKIFQDFDEWIDNFVKALQHRGPDDQNLWYDKKLGVVLGHRRLSILDLSPKGQQPMISNDENYVIVCNGEIYNFLELRQELRKLGHCFRGNSDTEVMLAAFEQWGIDAVSKFCGMFAFALLETKSNTLFLVRDRLGIKPLYYGWVENHLLFASELKPFFEYPRFSSNISHEALSGFLQFGYVPSPLSIFEGIYKLNPGKILKITPHNSKEIEYWSLKSTIGDTKTLYSNTKQAQEGLESLLRKVVQQHCLSDVPLGAFLSGGIDSSTVVALMQSLSKKRVKTFTIGFHESGYDEAQYAKKIANHLGTEHTELYVTAEDAISVIPDLPKIYDEPFADSSQIPTYLVSQLAKQRVTVALSGDGGDELFAGYNRYIWAEKIWSLVRKFPVPLRYTMSQVLQNRFLGVATKLPLLSSLKLHEKLPKLASTIASKNLKEVYWQLVSLNNNPATVLSCYRSSERPDWPEITNDTAAMMYIDTLTYLPDDILTKVDRASMAHGLEARVPLLDHRVVEFSWKIPLEMKLRENCSKWILRQVLKNYAPLHLFNQPKMGFAIPVASWLRGPLRDWACDLLNESAIQKQGLFCSQEIAKRWQEHMAGSRNWQSYLWPILMFQAWKDYYAK